MFPVELHMFNFIFFFLLEGTISNIRDGIGEGKGIGGVLIFLTNRRLGNLSGQTKTLLTLPDVIGFNKYSLFVLEDVCEQSDLVTDRYSFFEVDVNTGLLQFSFELSKPSKISLVN